MRAATRSSCWCSRSNRWQMCASWPACSPHRSGRPSAEARARMDRRCFLAAGLACAAAPAWPRGERYPGKPIRVIVPFAAGGGGDFVTRLLAPRLGELLGTTLLVENRTGASGNIGTEAALKSPPDGYTLLTISGTYATQIAASKLSFDPFTAITPLTQLTQQSTVILVN